MDELKASTVEDFNLFQVKIGVIGNINLKTLSFQNSLYRLDYAKPFQLRQDPAKSITDMERFVPWFLKCNPQRYPYWFGHTDPRNQKLREALKDYFNFQS